MYVIIKPVYKKGDKLLTTNYRPISLLTFFSKIFKKLIHSRLYKHICNNNIPFIQEQYGFGINSSTEAATYNVINEILKSTNNRLSVGGIFCDLKKAFYCVNHGILTDKLEFYGISGKFLTLIHSYLRERYQKYSLIKLTLMMVLLLDRKRLQMGFFWVRSWVHYFFLLVLTISLK